MSVNQLKDGRWICRHPKGKNPQKPDSTAKYFGRGADAEQKAIAFNLAIGLGHKETDKGTTLVELANSYLTAKQSSMKESTFPDTCNRIENNLLPYFGEGSASSIGHAQIDSYVASRLTSVTKATVRNELTILRAILNWSAKRRLISANPMAGYQLPKPNYKRILPPNKQEIDAICACSSPHLERAILLSYYTGLRPGKTELFCLTWDSVDFGAATLMVTSASKGGIPVRMIPLGETIIKKLTKWRAADKESKTMYIVNYKGRQVASMKNAWSAAKRRAGIKRKLRLYDIRHAFITTLLEKGADLKSVSEMAGHASPEMTLRVYQHVSSDLKRQTINLLE